ncbi:hypothetical protein FQR65_LT02597 [Abscondita terminalis]|nr:hypothetical protein FQR65_LT02597 [Abscondita terminalis]
MLSSLRTKLNNSEYDTKFIQDRIVHTEKNFAELCSIFAQYSRKIARVRDKGDNLIETLIAYAENEEINKSLSVGLTNFVGSFTVINDYGDVRVKSVDKKIVDELSKYESICKQVKDDVKQIFADQEKELARRKQFKRVRERKGTNRQLLQQAESELTKAQLDVSKTIVNIEEKIITFEKQKLHDLKGILLDFVAIEIGYHAKALEQLTKAYTDIAEVNEDADLEVFKEIVTEKGADFENALCVVQSPFKSSQSMGSINTLGARVKRTSGIPTAASRPFKSEEHLDISDSIESDSEQEESSINTEISTPVLTKKQYK